MDALTITKATAEGIDETNKKWRRRARTLTGGFLAAALVVAAIYHTATGSPEENSDISTRRRLFVLSPDQANDNADQIKEWRQESRRQCDERLDVDAFRRLSTEEAVFQPPHVRSVTHEYNLPVEACPFVFLDVGSGIGDSVKHFIDAGLVGCDSGGVPAPVYSTDSGKPSLDNVFAGQQENEMTTAIRHLLAQRSMELERPEGRHLGPEDYCVYGVEGNPVFTEELRNLERLVMRTNPRPLRRLHFFTETVAAPADGPTNLYLDTVNPEHNYWGTSLMPNHVDVIRSAKQLRAETQSEELIPPSVSVMGHTLSTIVRQTTSYFFPPSAPQEKTGGHLIIKMDIEGAEYSVLNEVFDTNTLCEYTSFFNKVDILAEFHSEEVFGEPNSSDAARYRELTHAALQECGIAIHTLSQS